MFYIPVLVFLFGAVIGSFLNVVIYRLPKGMSLSFPSSHCPKCEFKLRWYDNIPIISYIMLKGRCR
ncbi:MAG TPA: prepilin peptidase [Acholeplasmataceae bacterium]|nr:prepilin peptidase [Acholeplasmataceae bacterium]